MTGNRTAREPEHVTHTFAPVYDEKSRILILGTFPSVKSRETAFYYGHPQNRFWRVTAALTGNAVPETVEEKKQMLLENGIAIWDVIASCDIVGSSDSSIRNVTPNDIADIVRKSKITRIYANGGTAAKLYRRYAESQTGMEITVLPSTSPANAVFQMERLLEHWKVISEDLTYYGTSDIMTI